MSERNCTTCTFRSDASGFCDVCLAADGLPSWRERPESIEDACVEITRLKARVAEWQKWLRDFAKALSSAPESAKKLLAVVEASVAFFPYFYVPEEGCIVDAEKEPEMKEAWERVMLHYMAGNWPKSAT